MSACVREPMACILYMHESDNYEEIPKQIRANERLNSEQQSILFYWNRFV